MSGASARDGRRRRVLQEEVLSASREMPAYTGDDLVESGEGRRYNLTPDSLGAALARRHFPNHVLLPAAMIAAATVVSGGFVALDLNATQVTSQLGYAGANIADIGVPGSLANWASSTALLVAGIAAGLVLAVRRQRVDDYRGKYRLWRSAIALLAVASLVVGTGLHHAFAAMMSRATGVTFFAQGAGWWLVAGGILAAIVGTRVFLDIRESRFAAISLGSAMAALLLSSVSLTGWPAEGSTSHAMLQGGAVWGFLMIPTSLVAYMRFLRQDVAAGVATRLRVSRPQETSNSKSHKSKEVASETISITSMPRQESTTKREKKGAKQEAQIAVSRWTDGSDGIADDYDDEGQGQGRKLNKADRKRMRREKEERWAA